MNSYERVKTVLEGKIPDKIPVCLIDYISSCREAGYTIGECFRDSKKLSNSLLKSQRKYGHDIIHVQNGVYGIAQSLGCKIKYFNSTCPVITERPYKDYEEFINKYSGCNPEELETVICETVESLSDELDKSVCIRAEISQGPFSLAGELFGLETFLIDVIDESKESIIKEMLYIFTDIALKRAKEYKDAGAHIVSIGDSFLSPDVVSTKIYEKFGFPYHKFLVSELKKMNLDLIIHICGNATDIVTGLTETGVAAIELDHKINNELCRDITSGKCTIMGNLDPSNVICNGSPELVTSKAKEAIEIFGKGGFFILGSGCDLPFETPERNIYALVNASRKFGIYKK